MVGKNDRDLGHQVREFWSGDRNTPNKQQQAPLFHTGIVMDDSDDEQRNGRIWVYIPGFSPSRGGPGYSNDGLPNYGGTATDRKTGRLEYDNRLRSGWILCYPIMPFFGSDESRVESSSDNRNARTGDVVSYGSWLGQPRIGDEVAILFANGDPARAYYIGCIPKQNRNFMVPGHAGTGIKDVGSNYNPGEEPSEEEVNFNIPALDKAGNNPQDKKWISSTFTDNLQQAGLLTDGRGAGTASSRRESPSYVFGLKTPGWNYDGEKYNKDADGKQFKDKPSHKRVNTTGHQIVMDDHPEYQGIRIRTSYGSQLYLDDSCDEPYIYLSTAKGNVWIELCDGGDVNVFSEGSISLHAKQDVNIVADRDINLEARRNFNVRSVGDGNVNFNGSTNMHFGQSGKQGMFVTNYGDMHHTVGNNYNLKILSDMNISVENNIKMKATANVNIGSDAEIRMESAGDYSMTSGGTYREMASFIHMNTSPGNPAELPIGAMLPAPTKLGSVAGSPTRNEISSGLEASATEDSIAPIVPQHQPWTGRCGRLRGTNGHVEVNPEYAKKIRKGSARSTSSRPLPVKGKVGGQSGVYRGEEYSSSNMGEAPKYVKLRDLLPGEVKPAKEYTVSQDLIDYIKQKERFVACPYRDQAGLWTVGYGHLMKNGETINGNKVNLSELDSANGACDRYGVSKEEGTSLFAQDLSRFENCVRSGIDQDVTQGQYDGMVTLAYNIGCGGFKGSGVARHVNAGEFEKVPEAWVQWNKVTVNGKKIVSRGLVNRRREELEKFFNFVPDDPPDVYAGDSGEL